MNIVTTSVTLLIFTMLVVGTMAEFIALENQRGSRDLRALTVLILLIYWQVMTWYFAGVL